MTLQAPVSHLELAIFLKGLKEGYYQLDVWAVLKASTGVFQDMDTMGNYTLPADIKTPYPTEFSWVVKRSPNTVSLTSPGPECNVVPGTASFFFKICLDTLIQNSVS